MKNDTLQEVKGVLGEKRFRRTWKKAVSVLACAVVFGTVYALILPAVTLEKTPQCGKTEHTHSEECYTQVTDSGESGPVCTLETLGIHRHTDACLDENGQYVCGYSDFVVHKHDSSCYDENGNLWCPLPEIEAHTHSDSCYALRETQPVNQLTEPAQPVHTHTDGCYAMERGDLICTVSTEPHVHTEACYTITEKLICAIPESDGHHHNDSCLNEDGELICGIEESDGHHHGPECYEQTSELICPLSEEPHQHTDACYTQNKVLICGLSAEAASTEASVSETEQSKQRELICGRQEIILHQHTDACFDGNGALICGQTQVTEHVHNQDCFRAAEEPTDTETLICQLEEHTHSAACPVIGMIEELPDRQSVEERMAAFKEAGDEEGSDAYLTDLQTRVQEAYDAYIALPEDEQAKVTNLGRLTALDWLCGIGQQENTNVSVTDGEGNSLDITPWTGATGDVRARLQAALLSTGQGYTIKSIEYYQISGLSVGTAAVTYNVGGLSAANGEKVFVYNLGADGTAEPQSCIIQAETVIKDEETGLFKSFRFEIPAGSDSTSDIYAFISAASSTLEEMGIYLGQRQDDGSWTAMDGADAESANVKATVTLAEGTAAPEGYSLFIREINKDERFYPNEEAIRAEAGEINGWQCYTIRWLKQETDGSLLMMPLNVNGPAAVRIEYLNDDARLSGPAGGRKLLIYNSTTDGSLQERVADTVENVTVEGDFYKTFTFEASHAGPYVFVSKFLEQGYIEQLAISGIEDGSAPFDGNDNPGNDSGNNNRIVRSYDTILYNLAANFRAREEGITKQSVEMYFEIILSKSATAARFDPKKMAWVGDNYGIEYLNEAGEVIMILWNDEKYYEPARNPDGTVIRDKNGFAQPDTGKPVSMNAQVNGSTSGSDSYKVTTGGVAKQRLVGCTTLITGEGENILSGTKEFKAAVEVRNADNGETFAPSFRMWLEGNEENYGVETRDESNGEMFPAQPNTNNVVDINEEKNKQYQVTVSAGTNFNIQLEKNNDMSYKNWFDFSSGREVEAETRAELVRLANLEENYGKSNPAAFTENGTALSAEKQAEYSNYRYGRLTCYGITLQLYNDTDNEPDKNRASKGLKGFSLPVGDITFDLKFYSEAKSNGGSFPGSDTEYTAILWDYNENVPANSSCTYKYADPGRGTVTTPNGGLGNGGRNLYWDGEIRSSYAKGAAVSNYIGYFDGCYYGGDWTLTNEGGIKAAHPNSVTGTGSNTTYHFSVSDYDFDFDNQHFPARNAGNSGEIPAYKTYARCFSAGCVQVLSVFPMAQKQSEAEIFLNAEVDNLHLITRAKQECNKEVTLEDNKKRDQIVLYKKGNLTKGSSFNGMYNGSREPQTTSEGFLGTDYWTTSFDCSAFAGDDIWLISYGMMSSGSDYRTRSMNLLQLFDSYALSIREKPSVRQEADPLHDKTGTVRFLYAADPKHPEGYNTNTPGVLEYMNTVREEDLVYSVDMPGEDGIITASGVSGKCVGVLMEMRGCDLLGGKYQYMRIPVRVRGDDPDLISKTVATVNTFRAWSWDLGSITWANGVWNSNTGKNELTDYSCPTGSIEEEGYSSQLANRVQGSPPNYVKTEYENNLQKTGTHAGGTLSGNSLLILGYKASVNINVDNKTGQTITYNQGNGETVVDYRLESIRTDLSDHTGQTNAPNTTLTIRAVLDEKNEAGKPQRISVAEGSYRIEGYLPGTETIQNFSISSDPDNPTELEYIGSDNKRHRIRVYAALGANSQSVSFTIMDAPVGIALPDITFQANFAPVTSLTDSAEIKTSAYIGGEGDQRAYSETKGNTANKTVYVVLGSSSNLTKAVNTRYIELDGVIEYVVTYSNSGTDTIPVIYFYDLLPKPDDIRGSNYEGEVVLKEFNVKTTNPNGKDPAGAIVYYSTTEYTELYNTVKVFGGEMEENGTIKDMNAQKVEEMLASGENEEGEQLFLPLGQVTKGTFGYDESFVGLSETQINERMAKVTGLYIRADDLKTGQTIELSFKIKTENNAAGNWYKNIANSWIADSATLPLTSNKVETQAVSRTISGVVWYDRNLNGIREDDEPRLDGVTATLFKKNGDTYEVCVKNVTDGEKETSIAPVTTDENGVYSFPKLAAGEYIIAFSGDVLNSYTDVTEYQKNGGNKANTNDGKATSELSAAIGRAVSGIDPETYKYFICYSAGSESMNLHSIDEMGTVTLNNGVEEYIHQDLGLVSAIHELPETGGFGTTPYTIGGLLVICAGMLLLYIKKRAKGDMASS